MGYQEKSAWACSGSILVVFVPYFLAVFQAPMAYVALFVMAVVGLVALLAGFHIINAIVSASIRKSGDVPKPDELDRIIELRAAKLSGIVLGVVVLMWLCTVMLWFPVMGIREIAAAAEPVAADFSVPVVKAMLWVHGLFAGFVVANLVYYGAIVASYRRLADE